MADYPDLTLDDLRSLLLHINADTDRETWVQVGMGVKAEFGEDGWREWDTWSASGSDYKQADAESAWKSFKGNKVGIGTVIHLAKQGGWQREKRELTPAERKQMKADQQARRARRQAEVEADEKRLAVMQRQVQAATIQLFAEHTKARGKSPYIERKQVGAYGLRFVTQPVLLSVDSERQVVELWTGNAIRQFFDALPDPRPDHISFLMHKPGDVLVPLAGLDGTLWSYQCINATGTKLFPKFSRKQRCCHWIGRADPMRAVVLAEGYATSASVFEALEWTVVMCVDLGNMSHIGRALREQYPDLQILIAGDDDPKADGTNPGRTHAEALAIELGAVAVFPCPPEPIGEAA